mmetsp:Transcript_8714/g.22322  ORF Transcript_8714/g.22322 Transcript_8714/m.22322 type:complete len:331 (-) Transcript_8714:98-1090(-)
MLANWERGWQLLPELVEVGLSLGLEGGEAFESLLVAVEHLGGETPQLLHARVAVVHSIHGGLENAQGQGGIGQHLAAPMHGLLLKLRERHHLVHEAHLVRLLRCVQFAQEPHLLRLLRTDEPGHDAASPACVEGTHLRARLPVDGVVRRHCHVAKHVDDVAAADRVPGHHRDHWLGNAAQNNLKVEKVESRDAIFAHVASHVPHPLVPSAAESLRATPRENDGGDARVLLGVLEAANQLQDGARREGVPPLGPVDGDLRDALVALLVDRLAKALSAELERHAAPVHGRVAVHVVPLVVARFLDDTPAAVVTTKQMPLGLAHASPRTIHRP